MTGAILIVARNNLSLTKSAVRTAMAQTAQCDVLVVDNASYDGTSQWLQSKLGIAHISYDLQRSLAYCWNKGITALFTAGYTEVLVANNDVELRTDTFDKLLCMIEEGAHFCTCVSVDSRDKVEGYRDRFDLWRNRRPHPDFSCFMLDRHCWDKVGKFDEQYYPAYYEDNDYHVRMHRAGIEAVCVDLPFYHVGASTVKNAYPGEKDRINRYAASNKQLFWKRYGCMPGTEEYEALFKV